LGFFGFLPLERAPPSSVDGGGVTGKGGGDGGGVGATGGGGGAGLGGWGAGGGGGWGGFGVSGFGFSGFGFSGFGPPGVGLVGFGRPGGRTGLTSLLLGRSPRAGSAGAAGSAASEAAAASSESRAETGCTLRRSAAARRRSALRARVVRADGVAASATNGTLVSWTTEGRVGTTSGCAGDSVARAQSQAEPLTDVTATATFAATARTMSNRLIICSSSSAARRIPASA
jgi:hypothetical protein